MSVGFDSRAVPGDAIAAIAQVPRWYHSITIAPGVITPGLFDLRAVVDRLPWPDVRGKRCLDVGTSDGFLAFELERRGAAEVVAIDLPAHDDWDWEIGLTELGPEYLRTVAGPAMGTGLATARRLLRSSIDVQSLSAYELTTGRIGEFDVIVCGSLLLHLRDPMRALAAIRSVCRGHLLCTNQIDLGRSVTHPHAPLVRLDGTSGITQWWIPNAAGHRQMLRAAGFTIERAPRPYAIPFGPAHPPRSRTAGSILRGLGERLLTGNEGVPHVAVLARPR